MVDVKRISRLTLLKDYNRPTTMLPNGQLFDEISDAPMSTAHAIARFHVPRLCEYSGWALFTDSDVIFREDIANLFALADPQYAVMCVQHPPLLKQGNKKDGHIQQAYPRKNWSSVMLFNCGHSSNQALTLDVLNAWPGRDLHAFRWLQDHEIGALPARFNWLVGVSAPDPNPAIAHFTLGTPDVSGHENDPFAAEWFSCARVAGFHDLAAAFHTEIG
jgi:lipopolysaccharide biosynthesis glycosyltransferase